MITDRNELRRLHVIFLLILAVGVSILFFQIVQSFVVAVVVAAILASLAHPFHTRVAVWLGGRKSVAASVTVVLGLLIVVLPLLVFLGFVAEEAVSVSKSATTWFQARQDDPVVLDRVLDKIPFVHKDQVYAKSSEVAHKVAHFAVVGLGALSQGTARFFLMVFVMLYSMYYFLLAGPALPERVLRYLPLTEEEGRRTLSTFTSVSRATLVGAVVIGAIQGGLGGIGLAVAGINGVLLWTVVMAVASIIPGIGTALVWVPAVIYLVVEGRYGAAVGLGLWCAIVVGSVDNFLRPILVGKGTGLPNVLVLLGTLGGLMYFGPIGIVLGPVVAALFLTVWDLYELAIHDAPEPSDSSPETPEAPESGR